MDGCAVEVDGTHYGARLEEQNRSRRKGNRTEKAMEKTESWCASSRGEGYCERERVCDAKWMMMMSEEMFGEGVEMVSRLRLERQHCPVQGLSAMI
jgi:hypothetical protein